MIIRVKIKPNSSKQEIKKLGDASYVLHLKSVPKNNRANMEMINFLAKRFRVSNKNIKIKSGKTSNKKIIEIK